MKKTCDKTPLLTANNAGKHIPMNGLEQKRSAKVSLLFNNAKKKNITLILQTQYRYQEGFQNYTVPKVQTVKIKLKTF